MYGPGVLQRSAINYVEGLTKPMYGEDRRRVGAPSVASSPIATNRSIRKQKVRPVYKDPRQHRAKHALQPPRAEGTHESFIGLL